VKITYHAAKGGDGCQKVDAAIRLDVAQDGSDIEFRHRGLRMWYAGFVSLLSMQEKPQFEREARRTEHGKMA
jgi:hypothetical protein